MSFATGGALSGSFEPVTRYGPVGGRADEKASVPGTEATNATNFLAASMFLLVLGMYWPPGSHRVAPALLASSPGMPKKPILAASAVDNVEIGKVSMGYCAALPCASCLIPWAKVVEPALLLSQPFCFGSAAFSNPFRATGSVAYLVLFAVYSSAHLGFEAATLWKSPSTYSCEVKVSLRVPRTGVIPAALILSLFDSNSAHVLGTES